MKLPGTKDSHKDKVSRNPIKIYPSVPKKKPAWLKIELPHSENFKKVKEIIHQNNLHTVCEEASCPNIGECFSKGTATFMIMGDICTRRCPFCDVSHGRPLPLDKNEPKNLAESINKLNLNYVVVTSVDRDDLKDGGAGHFVECIDSIRNKIPSIEIEILIPDFRGREQTAIKSFAQSLPDVLNHNIETVPRLYKEVRPGSVYSQSLKLLKDFSDTYPELVTKSGFMIGLGETFEEIEETLADLAEHNVKMVTIGQYLQPSMDHLPVHTYYDPAYFERINQVAKQFNFSSIACGPFVRSSYHADIQAKQLS
ncbi:lipoyl synthase [Methylophilales bacterium MBRSG12]|uniref:Lipoyl synthase n=1 Tax=Methylophilales bacterium MBRS-H7 TaxID=1623450 RepID=A0A0H4J2C8_9PROT|nr:lipoyl synthase [Methylophilales bacterium MBRSF5]AKO65893.1 lipoyl synthase [Methylophilales bacterium MBRS-H7]AKO67213.1 lipoyl synthase [Methylophilales bacterium MBRSG12]